MASLAKQYKFATTKCEFRGPIPLPLAFCHLLGGLMNIFFLLLKLYNVLARTVYSSFTVCLRLPQTGGADV